MRRIKDVIALSMGALLWGGAGAWAQHAPGSVPQSTQSSGMQSPASQPQSTSATDKPGKPQKWSGKLVDAPCMMKALNTFAASTQQNASPNVPHFLGVLHNRFSTPAAAPSSHRCRAVRAGSSRLTCRLGSRVKIRTWVRTK